MLELKNISLVYEGRQLFDSFNLSIRKGEKVALTGPSGSGKTSLLNMFLGFTIPDSGGVYLDNYHIKINVHKVRSMVSYLPQNFNIIGSGKSLDVIMRPFEFSTNKKKTPSEEKINALINYFNLGDDYAEKDFRELSGGEKQRTGMMICLLLENNIHLLDEPTSALDADSTIKAAEKFLNNPDFTVLSVSHDEKWIKHCDRKIEINNPKV